MRKKTDAGRLPCYIDRPKLMAIVAKYLGARDVEARRAVCAVAPAGYGKTATAGAWAAGYGGRAYWLRAEEGDDNPALYYARLARTLAEAYPDRAASALLLPGPAFVSSPVDHLLEGLRLALGAGAQRQALLVLDDLHLLSYPAFAGSLPFVLSALPEGVDLFLLGRGGELLARLQSAFGAVRIDERHLRFSPGEVRKCYAAAGHAISGSEAIAVARRTDGWPIAVALMAGLARATGERTARPVVTGSEPGAVLEACIRHYFWEPCDPPTREVLLRTSLVEEIDAPLCLALTGDAEAFARLERLQERSLLVHREGDAFVHHHLLRDFLRARLEEEEEDRGLRPHPAGSGAPCTPDHFSCAQENLREVQEAQPPGGVWGGAPRPSSPSLHAAAAARYFETGDHYRAIRHALRSDRQQLVTRALREVMRYDRRNNSIESHVDKIGSCLVGLATPEMLAEHPYLHAALAWHAHLTGNDGAAGAHFDALHSALPEIARQHPDFLDLSALMHMLDHRFSGGNFYWRIPREILVRLPDGVRERVRFPGVAKNLPFAHKGAKDLFDLPGLPDDTAVLDKIAFFCGTGWEALYFAILAGIRYERNELGKALEHIRTAARKLPPEPMPDMVFVCGMTEIAILDAMEPGETGETGEPDKTDKTGETGKKTGLAERKREALTARLRDIEALYLLPNLHAYEAKLGMQDGDEGAAQEWLDRYYVRAVLEHPQDDERPLELFRVFQHLTTARALMIAGTPQAARHFLLRLVRLTSVFRRPTDCAEALTLLAVLEWHKGSRAEAEVRLDEALELVRAHGYIRLFADEGAAILPVVKQLAARAKSIKSAPADKDKLAYLREVRVAAFAHAERRAGLAAAMRTRPLALSPRQRQVLEYLAKGYERDEIAEFTGMSLSTVRSHAAAAFAKLGAQDRHEAVTKARDLHLI